jgi:hypothetical protein
MEYPHTSHVQEPVQWDSMPAQLREAFTRVAADSVPLDLSRLGYPARAITQQALDSMERRRIIGSTIGLSAIAFSQDEQEALVYGEIQCGGACGFGTIYYLRRTHNSWRIAATFRVWVG